MNAVARPAWVAFAGFASLVAAIVVSRWIWAVSLAGPILYGEGAVAHAALLARDGAEYVPFTPPVFVAANYTPLYFNAVSLGDPFVWGRIVSIACSLFVAGAIAWRARASGISVALALACAWLAMPAVALWGPAIKPDLLACALTLAGVVALDRIHNTQRGAAVAGVLLALAVAAKPTAALPALALAAWLLSSRRATSLAYFATAGLVTGALVVLLTPGGLPALSRHVLDHNALPWSAERAALLALIGLALLLAPLAIAFTRRAATPSFVYIAGAFGIVLLGGREGGTVNYLIDLAAASLLALASVASSLPRTAIVPAILAAQVVVGIALLDPTGLSARQGSGAWLAPERLAAARALPAGPILAEDAGLLVMQAREPIVDDLFLWSRLVARGRIDPQPLMDLVGSGQLVRIVSDFDLARLDTAPAFVRERWDPRLVAAVLARYQLSARDGGLFIYAPR